METPDVPEVNAPSVAPTTTPAKGRKSAAEKKAAIAAAAAGTPAAAPANPALASTPENPAPAGTIAPATAAANSAPAQPEAPKEPGKIEQIIEWHKKGLSNKEIAEKGFNKTTISIQVAKYKKSLEPQATTAPVGEAAAGTEAGKDAINASEAQSQAAPEAPQVGSVI